MTDTDSGEQVRHDQLPNGAGVAALLAAGLGALALAVLAIVADHSSAFKKLMIFYVPTGALSGVTTTAIAVWLLLWVALDAMLKRREVRARWIAASLGLLAISFLLMCPPVGDLF